MYVNIGKKKNFSLSLLHFGKKIVSVIGNECFEPKAHGRTISRTTRFRNLSHILSITPAPNRYSPNENDIARTIQKQAGTKGPYACFTGHLINGNFYTNF